MGASNTVMKRNTPLTKRLTNGLSSQYFFVFVIVLMAFQALWIALSGRYPMAFDENYHLGIIRLYSMHLSPFWDAHPAGADSFGAIARDPSYLYHYLMSFPYRLISSVTNSQATQVIMLRIINVSVFTGGLVLWRKLLLKSGASRALVHTSLLVFVLIPIVPFLAAQINYDNLFIPAVACVFLLAINLAEELRKYNRINTKLLAWLLISCLLASLVKYAFLPIFISIIGYLTFLTFRVNIGYRKLLFSLKEGWNKIDHAGRWFILLFVLLSLGLFAERYFVNIVRYHAPVPDCSQVLTVKQCQSYGPWVRDYILTNNKIPQANTSPITFTADWFYGMWFRSFFAVGGPQTNFETKGPLLLPSLVAIVLSGLGLVSFSLSAKKIWQKYNHKLLTLFGVSIATYVIVLWVDGYRSFLSVGQTVAINGRYLLPLALPIILLGGLSINELLNNKPKVKLAIAATAVICFSWGGGALTYVLRSGDAWNWQNKTVDQAYHAVQRTIGPLTPGFRHPQEFTSRN